MNGIFTEYQWKINGILMALPFCVIKHRQFWGVCPKVCCLNHIVVDASQSSFQFLYPWLSPIYAVFLHLVNHHIPPKTRYDVTWRFGDNGSYSPIFLGKKSFKSHGPPAWTQQHCPDVRSPGSGVLLLRPGDVNLLVVKNDGQ